MALTEKIMIDLIEIVDFKNIQVRQANIIEKDGVQIAKTFHRYVLSPGDDVSNQDQRIKDISAILWANTGN